MTRPILCHDSEVQASLPTRRAPASHSILRTRPTGLLLRHVTRLHQIVQRFYASARPIRVRHPNLPHYAAGLGNAVRSERLRREQESGACSHQTRELAKASLPAEHHADARVERPGRGRMEAGFECSSLGLVLLRKARIGILGERDYAICDGL